jgi:ABC-type nitrate/sulfonate/bicarbonate transport system substrate-binding protein
MIWLTLAAAGAGVWRLLVTPLREQTAAEEEEAASAAALQATQGDLPYDHEVTIALDSFSGYAVLRSPTFSQLLRREKIKLNLIDDAADYSARLEGLRDGRTQMAAFTIDALIKTTADMGRSPATIVSLIDETQGADAIVAAKDAIKNVDDLNHADVRFVLTPDSPSETLARVVMNTFALDQLPEQPFVMAKDAADVVQRYRNSQKNSREVFVLWEPFVSKILANDSMHVVIDSSRFTGYIVDCLVADRDFLVKQPEIAATVVECYFRALYEYRQDTAMQRLVLTDAGESNGIDATISEKLVKGIRWKNTQENLAHFGLRSDTSSQHIADMIENITRVLLETGAIAADPTGGQPNKLYFDTLLRNLRDAGFHPGDETEEVREATELVELSDEQWQKLVPVGTLSVPDLVFPRGTASLTSTSQLTLDELVEKLATWPQYYVIVRGNASLLGDLEANKALASRRAKATEEYLIRNGVSPGRIRAVGVDPSGTTKVNFVLGQLPY